MYEIIEQNCISSNGVTTLRGVIYQPKGEYKGIVQVTHGMTEYIGRYDAFMGFLADAGYIAVGYDQLGHGKTAESKRDLGFIAKKNGWDYLLQDVEVFAKIIREKYPNLPYYLFGHSMGSFVARGAATKHIQKIDKLILCGTSGPTVAYSFGVGLTSITKFFKGARSYSPLTETIAFGSYNSHFKDEKDRRSWLTKDLEMRQKYKNDPFCNYHFTTSALKDLIYLNKLCNANKWFKEICQKCPILLVSGQDDPVGNYGNGVTSVFKKLQKNKANVQIKLYENCRHEILNDTCKEEVEQDILQFLNT